MKRVCAWCTTVIAEEGDDEMVTHTICDSCKDNIEFQSGVALQRYIDSLHIPIFVMNCAGQLTAANTAACELLNKSLETIYDQLGGDVFECAYARRPEGCGQTVHCSGCAIRRTVMDTFTTGESHYRVPAHLTRSSESNAPIDLWITTEKIGNSVLLTLDAFAHRTYRAPCIAQAS
jgi:hypothetical protein